VRYALIQRRATALLPVLLLVGPVLPRVADGMLSYEDHEQG
jgi:hypothetical protein